MTTAEWIAGIVIGLGTAIINKIWNKSSNSLEQSKSDLISQCETAIATARSVMTQIILTAKPDATIEWVVQQCKGAVAIQVAKLRSAMSGKAWAIAIIDSLAVQTLIDKAITDAVKTFVEVRLRDQRTMNGVPLPPAAPPEHLGDLPVLKKIAALTPSDAATTIPGVRRAGMVA